MKTEKIIEIMQHFKCVLNVDPTKEKSYFPESILKCCGRIIENKDKICPICNGLW
jgi:hypothetical protein